MKVERMACGFNKFFLNFCLAALTLLIFTNTASAKFLFDLNLPTLPELKVQFLDPNETQPVKEKEILTLTSPGVYISVGTERGFIGASLSPDVTHLLLIDYEPKVVLFNRINIALLEMAQSQNDYVWLRLHASADEWKSRAKSCNLENYLKVYVSEPGNLLFFRTLLEKPGFQSFDDYELGLRSGKFVGANYLFNLNQFEKISKLAKKGLIQAEPIDLRDHDSVDKIISALSKASLKISVLDLSNACDRWYVPKSDLTHLLNAALPVMESKTILLITVLSNIQNKTDFFWDYFAFEIGQLSQPECLSSFLDTIKSGNLYQLGGANTLNNEIGLKNCQTF
jgi:hypothetical protein